MANGTALSTVICNRKISLGDWVRVRYMTGGWVEGEIIELWEPPRDTTHQARVDSGWCFHQGDTIEEHQPKANHDTAPSRSRVVVAV